MASKYHYMDLLFVIFQFVAVIFIHIGAPKAWRAAGTEPHRHHGKSKETHELIFFVVIMASGIARGRVRTTTTTTEAALTETRLNLFSWVFCCSAPSIAELMKFLQRTNVKEKSREQAINRDRSSQVDHERERARLKERRRKSYWTVPWNRVSPEGDETIPNNAMNQSEKEPKNGGEIPKKLTQRAEELSKLNPVTKLMYTRARTYSGSCLCLGN